MNNVEPIESSMLKEAKELTLCKLEFAIKNHRDPINGYDSDTFEHDWASLFIEGVNIRKAGGICPPGSNETTVRGYKAQNDYMIGSK